LNNFISADFWGKREEILIINAQVCLRSKYFFFKLRLYWVDRFVLLWCTDISFLFSTKLFRTMKNKFCVGKLHRFCWALTHYLAGLLVELRTKTSERVIAVKDISLMIYHEFKIDRQIIFLSWQHNEFPFQNTTHNPLRVYSSLSDWYHELFDVRWVWCTLMIYPLVFIVERYF
jgi:hypothetical protein